MHALRCLSRVIAVATALLAAPAARPESTVPVPASFEAGRVFATPQTVDHRTLRLLVDTGGGGQAGMPWITRTMADTLRLGHARCELDGQAVSVVAMPRWDGAQALPSVRGPCTFMMVLDLPGTVGMLGASYLARRDWVFDYPGQHLFVIVGAMPPPADAHATPLSLKTDAEGTIVAEFPRVTMQVDGEDIEMLLDTGATGRPAEVALATGEFETVDGETATSFITTLALNDWHRRHPDWRVIDQADTLLPGEAMRMIRVPAVTIAGWTVGPVWFTERPTYDFGTWMSTMTDKPIEGAVGGNLLRHFVVTLDYGGGRAWFSKP